MCGQIERAPTSGRLHIQFYFILTRKVRVGTCRKYFNPGLRSLHFEKCRGTHGQNIAYCKKESTRYGPLPDYGEFNPGKDTEDGGHVGKIARLIDTAQLSGLRMALVEQPVTGLQNIRNLQTYLQIVDQPAPSVRCNIFLYGPPQCGKTRFAYALFGSKIYAKTAGKWFDGYYGQPAILWDEINTLSCPIDLLLRCCDRYPLTVEIKGSSVPLHSKVNLFTSNLSFDPAFFSEKSEPEELRNALRDRFYLILTLTDKDITPDCTTWPFITLKSLICNPVPQCCVVFGTAYIYIADVRVGDRYCKSDIIKCFTDAGLFTVEPDSSAELDPSSVDDDTNHGSIQTPPSQATEIIEL